MKRAFSTLLVLAVVTANAQEKVKSEIVKNPKPIKTASGLEYTITSKGNGKLAQRGDNVTVHYTGKLTNDTIFDSSIPRNQPFDFKLGAGRVIKGWDEAFTYLHVGDKATLRIPPELGYGANAMPKIPANSTLIFDVELLSLVEGPRPFDTKGKDTVKTASGLQMIFVKKNEAGQKASEGTMATFNYSAYFRDGKMFDSSLDRNQPMSIKSGKGQLGVAGWEEAITLMRAGEKARVIVPSKLAFGEKGFQTLIPPNTDLILDIEMTDVKVLPVPVPFDIKGLEVKTTASGLKYYEVKRAGSATKAAPHNMVKVHYTGYFADGKVFDSSVERGQPIEFPLGHQQVIPGWEEGIAMMGVGDKLRLVIPYQLAYGEQGRPPMIPEKAELTFDVELVSATPETNCSASQVVPQHQEGDGHQH